MGLWRSGRRDRRPKRKWRQRRPTPRASVMPLRQQHRAAWLVRQLRVGAYVCEGWRTHENHPRHVHRPPAKAFSGIGHTHCSARLRSRYDQQVQVQCSTHHVNSRSGSSPSGTASPPSTYGCESLQDRSEAPPATTSPRRGLERSGCTERGGLGGFFTWSRQRGGFSGEWQGSAAMERATEAKRILLLSTPGGKHCFTEVLTYD